LDKAEGRARLAVDNRWWWEPIWSAKYRGDRLGTGARAEVPTAAGALPR
jgi:hypothetical protein